MHEAFRAVRCKVSYIVVCLFAMALFMLGFVGIVLYVTALSGFTNHPIAGAISGAAIMIAAIAVMVARKQLPLWMLWRREVREAVIARARCFGERVCANCGHRLASCAGPFCSECAYIVPFATPVGTRPTQRTGETK